MAKKLHHRGCLPDLGVGGEEGGGAAVRCNDGDLPKFHHSAADPAATDGSKLKTLVKIHLLASSIYMSKLARAELR